MAIKFCTPTCKNLRSVRFGFDSSRIVGASYDKKDKQATCVLRPEATIIVASRPECLIKKER